MTANGLRKLVGLVDRGDVNLVGFYYPTISPALRLKWTAIYQYDSIDEYTFDEFDNFLNACEGLANEIGGVFSFGENVSPMPEAEINEGDACIQKIVNLINDEISKGIEPVWLFGLEYSKELRDEAAWIGTIEGDVYLNMRITKEDTSLTQVCKYIMGELEKLKGN